jgi:cobalamin biosynthetic protein CobC
MTGEVDKAMDLRTSDRSRYEAACELRVHGGRVDIAASLYPFAPQPWIDLSTGINPQAWPVPPVAIERYQRLPTHDDISQLRHAAADFYGLPDNAEIIPVPGSEIAIRWLPKLMPSACVGILGPTYRSHTEVWTDAGAKVEELSTLPDPATSRHETLVIVNPNNPDGRIFPRAQLAAFATAWTATGRHLIVDEAFAEVVEGSSLLGLNELPAGVVVLRSLGKFFGLAGLRVGFVIVAKSAASAWHRALGDWPVSGPACEIAGRALRDSAWITQTKQRLAYDRQRLDGVMKSAGFRVIGGTDLFGLFSAPDDRDWLDHYAKAGILIRGFNSASRHYRIGLPPDKPAWQRLKAAASASR